MTAAVAVPAQEQSRSVNERLKNGFRARFWASMIIAVGVHFVVLQYSPQMTAEDVSITAADLTSIELPPEIEIPAPPQAIQRPATPVISEVAVDEDITIAPTTFDFNPVESLPPPPEETVEAAAEDLAAGPTFTPFTVAPTLLNGDEVAATMVESYPPMLRQSGIGGVVRVFFFINKEGVVEDYRIHQSSGFDELDAAALAVADVYRFSPAMNRDKHVPVWVSLPIEFQVR
jgi:TonB family protein